MKISRKDFIKKFWSVILIPYALYVILMAKKHSRVSLSKEVRISNNLNGEINFFEDVICIKSGEDVTVFSSKCTHLGCQINKAQDGVLICPCHGSKFDLQGKALKGPANKKLIKLEFDEDKATNEYIIKV